jgi:serine/threonine protein kinase
MVHRDIKPDNLCFHAAAMADDERDAGGRAGLKLIDFGCAARTHEPVVENTGTIATTPPEMFADAPHHAPADVWAMGIVLLWCMMLRSPLGELTLSEWEARISAAPPQLPLFDSPGRSLYWPAALEPMAAIARRCCARAPAERASAAAVRAACAAVPHCGLPAEWLQLCS